jgi:hypothetical protein
MKPTEIDETKSATYDKDAQRKYREKNRDKYNIAQRELYYKLHENDEWREMFNERSRRNNMKSRQKKREEYLLANPEAVIRKRGRPRKTIDSIPAEGMSTEGVEDKT